MKLIDQIAEDHLDLRKIDSKDDFKTGFRAAQELLMNEIQQCGVLSDIVSIIHHYGDEEIEE